MMFRAQIHTWVLVALCGVGCASASLDAPAGFARLDASDEFAWRAVSADGVVLAVRDVPNRPEANLAFWSHTVDERLRVRGYARDGEAREVRNRDGVAGTQFRYDRDEEGRAHRYWVTVFVRGSHVYVVEAGGDRETFDPARDAVERAVATLRW